MWVANLFNTIEFRCVIGKGTLPQCVINMATSITITRTYTITMAINYICIPYCKYRGEHWQGYNQTWLHFVRCMTSTMLRVTLRPTQHGRHFADDPFQTIFFWMKIYAYLMEISLLLPEGPFNKELACRRWIGADQVSHYLNQWWPYLLVYSRGLHELNF